MASAVSLLLLSSPRPLRRTGGLLRNPHRRSILLLPPPCLAQSPPRRLLAAPPRASNNNDDNSGAVEAPDRLVAAVAYLYPFLDGAHHGRFLLAQFPFFSALLRPLDPAARLFHSSPLTPFLLFLTLYFAVVRNQQAFSRFVRFNAMQAVVLDVLLIFPDLLAQSFAPRASSTPPRSRPSSSSSRSTSPSCATSRPSPASSDSTPCRPSCSTSCSSSPTCSRSPSRRPAGSGSTSSRAWRARCSSSCSSPWSTAAARACSGRRRGCPSSLMQPSAR